MFNKFELIGAGISVFAMGLALYLIQVQTTLLRPLETDVAAQVISATDQGVVVVANDGDRTAARTAAYTAAADNQGNIYRMVIDDIKFGTGEEVKEGDVVAVHNVGTLQNGQEFDNSRKRGEPFEFKVGGGMVIEGWDKGLLGMKVGGQRVLVIPPEMAYGDQGIGPIPGGSTLVFSIELMDIK